MKLTHISKLCIATCAIALTSACNESTTPKDQNTLSSGNVNIAVDETFKPVLENQLVVFHSQYPKATVNATYTNEADGFKKILNDSIKLLIATRQPTEDELKYAENHKTVLTSVSLAKDAIAIVVNPKNSDSALSVPQIKGILNGSFPKDYQVVFDHSGSSTVRFIMDSILKSETKIKEGAIAAGSNEAVIDFVAQNPNAIGFVGLSYVSDTGDSMNESFLSKVKVASIYNDKKNDFFKPYQAYIALGDYPLTRSIFYINRETYSGLGTGFANFLTQEKGQLIFSKFRFFPLKMNIIIRDAQINN